MSPIQKAVKEYGDHWSVAHGVGRFGDLAHQQDRRDASIMGLLTRANFDAVRRNVLFGALAEK